MCCNFYVESIRVTIFGHKRMFGQSFYLNFTQDMPDNKICDIKTIQNYLFTAMVSVLSIG